MNRLRRVFSYEEVMKAPIRLTADTLEEALCDLAMKEWEVTSEDGEINVTVTSLGYLVEFIPVSLNRAGFIESYRKSIFVPETIIADILTEYGSWTTGNATVKDCIFRLRSVQDKIPQAIALLERIEELVVD